MTERITSVKRLVDMAAAGEDWKNWYTLAQADITSVCAAQHWDFDRFVDVLAITSPRVSVRRKLRTIQVRGRCVQRIRQAAGRLCWRPAQTQAAIWATTVRNHGRNVPGFMVSDELLLPGMLR